MAAWRLHAAALTCALAILMLLEAWIRPILDAVPLPYDQRLALLQTLGADQPFTQGYTYVAERLRRGDSVVMLGSSELSSRVTPFTPYNFLPAKVGIPVTAIGRGHFQSFSHDLLLSSLEDTLSAKSKVVILFSPGWINVNRVVPDFFPFYIQDDLVYRTSRLGGDLQHLSTYLHDQSGTLVQLSLPMREVMRGWPQRDQLSLPRQILRMGARTLLQVQGLSYEWVADFHRLSLRLTGRVQPSVVRTRVQDIDWTRAEQQAIADETRLMTNNRLWVHDSYFTQFLTDYPDGGASGFKAKTYEETELFHLRRTLDLLRRHDARVLLVLLPLNGRVYNDLDRFQPVRSRIREMTHDLGVTLYDMWEEQPELGVLGDAMHVGSLGWVRINREIARWAH